MKNDVIKTYDNGVTTWKSENMGLFAAIIEGVNIAEVEMYQGHHSAADLRALAQVINEVAEALDPSPTPVLKVMEAIRYLETFKINEQPLIIPAGSSISKTLIALAEAVQEAQK